MLEAIRLPQLDQAVELGTTAPNGQDELNDRDDDDEDEQSSHHQAAPRLSFEGRQRRPAAALVDDEPEQHPEQDTRTDNHQAGLGAFQSRLDTGDGAFEHRFGVAGQALQLDPPGPLSSRQAHDGYDDRGGPYENGFELGIEAENQKNGADRNPGQAIIEQARPIGPPPRGLGRPSKFAQLLRARLGAPQASEPVEIELVLWFRSRMDFSAVLARVRRSASALAGISSISAISA